MSINLAKRFAKKGRNKTLVASGCFYYWFKKKSEVKQLNNSLSAYLDRNQLLDGFELYANFDSLGDWCERLCSGTQCLPGPWKCLDEKLQERILSLPHNRLHLSPLNKLAPGQEIWLARQLKLINQITGIDVFTTHPDSLSKKRLREIAAVMPKEVILSIENMDLRKDNFQTFSEIKAALDANPRVMLTLDICHWLELGGTLNSRKLLKFLSLYNNRVSTLHFSMPQSSLIDYQLQEQIETNHFLYFGSEAEIQRSFISYLTKDVAYVIEGVVPIGGFSFLEAEIDFISQL